MANRICYGYITAIDGEITINEVEAKIIHWIFECYINADSFGKIATALEKQVVLSFHGQSKRNREAINKLLSMKSTPDRCYCKRPYGQGEFDTDKIN